jgi:hypothetical protein
MIGYNLRRGTLLTCIAFAVVFSACEKSPAESVPEAGEISGTITFTGDAPSAGSIFISIQTDWPPRGAPYAFLPVTVSGSSFNYEFNEVAFGTYGAISISWEDPNDPNPATKDHVLGAYGGSAQSGFMDATSVTLTEENHELKNADFSADFKLAGPS